MKSILKIFVYIDESIRLKVRVENIEWQLLYRMLRFLIDLKIDRVYACAFGR